MEAASMMKTIILSIRAASGSGIRIDLLGSLSQQPILDLLIPTLCVAGIQAAHNRRIAMKFSP
jgi:hypothetical protein